MIYFFSSIFLIIIFAVLYGVFMKIADLLNEHGLKWFKGSAVLFGFLFGIFGALLVLGNNLIGNIMLAMVICMILRNRLDYLNHRIAASIIIIVFLFSSVLTPILFISFYATFLIFGALRDYIGEKIKKKSKLQTIYDSVMWYYPVPTLIYCLIYGNWIVFWAFLTFTIAYDLTKYVAKRKGYQ